MAGLRGRATPYLVVSETDRRTSGHQSGDAPTEGRDARQRRHQTTSSKLRRSVSSPSDRPSGAMRNPRHGSAPRCPLPCADAATCARGLRWRSGSHAAICCVHAACLRSGVGCPPLPGSSSFRTARPSRARYRSDRYPEALSGDLRTGTAVDRLGRPVAHARRHRSARDDRPSRVVLVPCGRPK